jgi:hypothetical protein
MHRDPTFVSVRSRSNEPGGKRMFKKILLGLAALIAVFLIVVAMQPDEFRVSRSATVAASPDRVFAQVNDFHNWQAWSPWAKLDPDAKATFEGPPAKARYSSGWQQRGGEGRRRLCKVGRANWCSSSWTL